MNFGVPQQKSFNTSNVQANVAENNDMAEARETLESKFP